MCSRNHYGMSASFPPGAPVCMQERKRIWHTCSLENNILPCSHTRPHCECDSSPALFLTGSLGRLSRELGDQAYCSGLLLSPGSHCTTMTVANMPRPLSRLTKRIHSCPGKGANIEAYGPDSSHKEKRTWHPQTGPNQTGRGSCNFVPDDLKQRRIGIKSIPRA